MKIFGARSVMLLCISLMFLVPSCAPKKVRIYDMPEGARSDLVQIALAQQGKKYRSGAKGPDQFDCSGLVYFTYRQAGISVPLTAEAQGRYGAEISRGEAQPGDLVLFRIKSDDHIGIMVNGSDFVHASKSRGVAIDSLESTYWRRYLIGFRKLM
ncbi:MAG: putative endopeptidase p60 precursor [Syntrophorhabdus sp. PtaB.Bin184]|jgi:cell wall-associated NlpC family hydrolase|nr:MAG: putative endopeptidase p60 precursor [Syntrophorhabdus sp. PtaB.Bin184]